MTRSSKSYFDYSFLLYYISYGYYMVMNIYSLETTFD
jgi:hypothetical protein